ncbi:MAG: hypothetical protein PHE81_04885 [Atribacterota bacterium]|nr:hypothetical protein [Atribacterota bacterium]
MGNRGKRELDEIINRLRYQLKAIIRKLNLHHQYIDGEDFESSLAAYLNKRQLPDESHSRRAASFRCPYLFA